MWTVSRIVAMVILTGLSFMDYKIRKSSERCTVIVYGRNGSISGSYTEYRLDGIAGRRADRYDIYRNQ